MSQKGRTPVSLLWSIAWRFLRGKESHLLNGTARAALVATLLGVTAMVIAMALMTGYREDLRRKLVRGNGLLQLAEREVQANGLAAHRSTMGEGSARQ